MIMGAMKRYEPEEDVMICEAMSSLTKGIREEKLAELSMTLGRSCDTLKRRYARITGKGSSEYKHGYQTSRKTRIMQKKLNDMFLN